MFWLGERLVEPLPRVQDIGSLRKGPPSSRGEPQHVADISLTHTDLIRRTRQALEGEFSNRLQHPVARVRSDREEPYQALVDKRGDAQLHIDAIVKIHHRLGRLQRPS